MQHAQSSSSRQAGSWSACQALHSALLIPSELHGHPLHTRTSAPFHSACRPRPSRSRPSGEARRLAPAFPTAAAAPSPLPAALTFCEEKDCVQWYSTSGAAAPPDPAISARSSGSRRGAARCGASGLPQHSVGMLLSAAERGGRHRSALPTGKPAAKPAATFPGVVREDGCAGGKVTWPLKKKKNEEGGCLLFLSRDFDCGFQGCQHRAVRGKRKRENKTKQYVTRGQILSITPGVNCSIAKCPSFTFTEIKI